MYPEVVGLSVGCSGLAEGFYKTSQLHGRPSRRLRRLTVFPSSTPPAVQPPYPGLPFRAPLPLDTRTAPSAALAAWRCSSRRAFGSHFLCLQIRVTFIDKHLAAGCPLCQRSGCLHICVVHTRRCRQSPCTCVYVLYNSPDALDTSVESLCTCVKTKNTCVRTLTPVWATISAAWEQIFNILGNKITRCRRSPKTGRRNISDINRHYSSDK